MSLYSDYIKEIEDRKDQELHPKPIDSGELEVDFVEKDTLI